MMLPVIEIWSCEYQVLLHVGRWKINNFHLSTFSMDKNTYIVCMILTCGMYMDLRTDRWCARLGSGESGRSSPLSSPPHGSSWSRSSKAESTNHPPSGNSSTLYNLSPAVCQEEDNQGNTIHKHIYFYPSLTVPPFWSNSQELHVKANSIYNIDRKLNHVTHFCYQVESVLPSFHFPLVLLLCLFKSHLLGKAWTRGGFFGSWWSLLMEVIKPVSERVLCILQIVKESISTVQCI